MKLSLTPRMRFREQIRPFLYRQRISKPPVCATLLNPLNEITDVILLYIVPSADEEDVLGSRELLHRGPVPTLIQPHRPDWKVQLCPRETAWDEK